MKSLPHQLLLSACFWALAGVLGLQVSGASAELSDTELSDTEMRRGKILFLQCRACHSLSPGDNEGKIGPSLAGVFGREAGSAAYYDNYSTALQEAGHEWDSQSMDRWLKGPAAMVPGTSMVFAGVADDAKRALLVRYLEAVAGEQAE